MYSHFEKKPYLSIVRISYKGEDTYEAQKTSHFRNKLKPYGDNNVLTSIGFPAIQMDI